MPSNFSLGGKKIKRIPQYLLTAWVFWLQRLSFQKWMNTYIQIHSNTPPPPPRKIPSTPLHHHGIQNSKPNYGSSSTKQTCFQVEVGCLQCLNALSLQLTVQVQTHCILLFTVISAVQLSWKNSVTICHTLAYKNTLRKAVHIIVNQTDCATKSTTVSWNSSFIW